MIVEGAQEQRKVVIFPYKELLTSINEGCGSTYIIATQYTSYLTSFLGRFGYILLCFIRSQMRFTLQESSNITLTV